MTSVVAWMRTGRRPLWLGGGLLVVVVAAVVWALWPSEPVPRAREYLDFSACLLTDKLGVAGPDAAPVWAGMQDASSRTRAKARYLSITGDQTTANAQPFLATLAQTHCDVIFVAGSLPLSTLHSGATQFPAQHFVAVGVAESQPNVSIVDSGSAANVRTAVAASMTAAVASSSN